MQLLGLDLPGITRERIRRTFVVISNLCSITRERIRWAFVVISSLCFLLSISFSVWN